MIFYNKWIALSQVYRKRLSILGRKGLKGRYLGYSFGRKEGLGWKQKYQAPYHKIQPEGTFFGMKNHYRMILVVFSREQRTKIDPFV